MSGPTNTVHITKSDVSAGKKYHVYYDDITSLSSSINANTSGYLEKSDFEIYSGNIENNINTLSSAIDNISITGYLETSEFNTYSGNVQTDVNNLSAAIDNVTVTGYLETSEFQAYSGGVAVYVAGIESDFQTYSGNTETDISNLSAAIDNVSITGYLETSEFETYSGNVNTDINNISGVVSGIVSNKTYDGTNFDSETNTPSEASVETALDERAIRAEDGASNLIAADNGKAIKAFYQDNGSFSSSVLDADISSLDHYYSFDDSNSDDDKGSLDGTDTSMTYAAGAIGNAAVFNGTSSQISLGSNNIAGAFSAGFICNIDSVASGFTFAQLYANSTGFLIFHNGSGQLAFGFRGGSKIVISTGDLTLTTGTNYQIIVTYNGSGASTATNYTCYVNGTSYTPSVSGTIGGSSTVTYLGSEGGGKYFDGWLDEVSLWSKVLSSAQATALYNSGTYRVYDAGTPVADLRLSDIAFEADIESDESSSNAVELDCNIPTHEITLTENITTITLSNTEASKAKNLHLLIIGDASSSYTVAFPAAWYWIDGTPDSDIITVAAGEIYKIMITAWGTDYVVASSDKTNSNVYDTIYIDAGAMVSRTTSGAVFGTEELSGNLINLDYYDFNNDSDEAIQFKLAMPDEWDLGTVKAKIYWKDNEVLGTGNVVWGIKAVAVGDTEDLDTSFGTPQTVTDSINTFKSINITSATPAITIGGTPTLGNMILYEVYRDADNGSDTYNQEARLLGVCVQYKELSTKPSEW